MPPIPWENFSPFHVATPTEALLPIRINWAQYPNMRKLCAILYNSMFCDASSWPQKKVGHVMMWSRPEKRWYAAELVNCAAIDCKYSDFGCFRRTLRYLTCEARSISISIEAGETKGEKEEKKKIRIRDQMRHLRRDTQSGTIVIEASLWLYLLHGWS